VNLAVAFIRLYDELAKVPTAHLRDFTELPEHRELAVRVAEEAARGSLAFSGLITDRQTAFGVAVGLHDALRRTDSLIDADPPPALARYRSLLAATHNLLPNLKEGALVTCHVQSRRPQGGPTQLPDFFPSLRRIDTSTFLKLGWVHLPRHRDLPIDKDLAVASLPFLADRDDVFFQSCRRGSYYTARPASDELIQHVPTALAALDASGAQLAVLPEAALDDRLLHAWQEACRRCPSSSGDLRLLLVGTGPVTVRPEECLLADEFSDQELGVLPHNRAVLLERATGEPLFAQDKQRGFAMPASYRRQTGLLIDGQETSETDEKTLDEMATDAVGLNVLESRSCRIAVLICEDLGRLTDTGSVVFRTGVSMVLTPVLAPPILPGKWQEAASKFLVPDGVNVVVVNSLALGREDLDQYNNYKPRVGVPAASVVAITDMYDLPARRPEEHEKLPAEPRDDALRVRIVKI
jgi:predicted amidohydrolase